MNKKKITEILTVALQHHKKNNLDIAKSLYEKVLKIDPNHFETIFFLGSSLSQSKNFVKGLMTLIFSLRHVFIPVLDSCKN